MKTKNNLQSMEKLLEICTGLGDKYQPGNQKLQVEAMTTLLSQAQTKVNALSAAKTAHNRATNDREVQFSDLGTLATRMVNALIASGATRQNVADARTFARKLSGTNTKDRPTLPSASAATPATDQAPVVKRRARGRDYTSKMMSFYDLIGLLEAEPNYQPQGTALQMSTLKNKLQTLSNSNNAVIHSAEVLRQARADRDAVLFDQSNSVYSVGLLAKSYMKAEFGFGSNIGIAVNKLHFNAKQK